MTSLRDHATAARLWNERNWDEYLDLFSDDAVVEQPGGLVSGKAAIRAALESGSSFWPDRRFTNLLHFENGDYVADEFTISGTFSAPAVLPDGTQLPPTGKPLQIKGVQVLQMRDGKVVAQRIYYDGVDILTQLGVMLPM